jgi:hypothetical protein
LTVTVPDAFAGRCCSERASRELRVRSRPRPQCRPLNSLQPGDLVVCGVQLPVVRCVPVRIAHLSSQWMADDA